MNVATIKASLGDIEAQMISSTNQVDDKIRDLHNGLRALRAFVEKRNEDINKSKIDKDDFYDVLDFVERILLIFHSQFDSRLIEALESISMEVKALTSSVRPEGPIGDNSSKSDFSVMENSEKNDEGMAGAQDKPDDSAEALTRQAET